MVAAVLELLEWSSHDGVAGVEPGIPHVFRRIRQFRLQSLVGSVMVAVSLAPGSKELGDCRERALPNRGGSYGMG